MRSHATTPSLQAPPPQPEHEMTASDETQRLQAILDLDLLNPKTGELVQDIVREAAQSLALPIALVTMVLDTAQFFTATHGIEGSLGTMGGTPIEWSFCQHVVNKREPFIVEDARAHVLVKDNPLVTACNVCCYLGIPLTTTKGHVVGTLCVLGHEPRAFNDDEMNILKELARITMERFENQIQR